MAIITVGNDPINRAASTTANVTRVDMVTPANASGKITQIEIYAATAITGGLQVALFSASGNNLTTRSYVDLGTAAAGLNTYTVDSSAAAISMNVVTGDYIGFYGNDGAVDIGANANNSQWWKTGDNIPCTSAAFSTATGRTQSIRGTGLTPLACALTGTVTASITEADIVTGGKTIILTIDSDTWIAAGALSFDLQRQNIINGITSAQSETFGWNLVPKALQGVSGVVRTSDTVVTITLDAQATYNITAQETITVTVPATALTGGVAVVSSPTFTVDSVSAGGWTNIAKLKSVASASISKVNGVAVAGISKLNGTAV